ALPSLRAALTGRATVAGPAQALPAIARANSWIIAACDVAGAVVFDDIELSILFVDIECATNARRCTITTGARNADPIRTPGVCAVSLRACQSAPSYATNSAW